MDETDWRKIFTNAWHTETIQEQINILFDGQKRLKVSREQLEQMVVQCCAMVMEINEKG
ncbi:hypothetical protein KY320_01385 [Candidatus Woesearchaeota archaeon]|nr:hypothetical protein [Candidatus Woesearchaeota archaeon]